MTLNCVFAGTPEFSAKILETILTNDSVNLKAIYTQPDRPAGRGRKLTPSAVKKLVQEQTALPIEQPLNFKKSSPDFNDNIAKLKSYNPDLLIVVAYGLILPREILAIPKYGCINIHTSLLPRWRGAAPIQRALLAGDCTTGVTIQQMDTGLDTGDIIASNRCDISEVDTTLTLTDKLLNLAGPLLKQVIAQVLDNNIQLLAQDESLVTYAHKLSKDEGIIDFKQDADYIHRLIRAFNPWPTARVKLNENNFIKIWKADVIKDNSLGLSESGQIIESSRDGLLIQCGTNKLLIKILQFSGGKAISIQDALNGKFKDLLIRGQSFKLATSK